MKHFSSIFNFFYSVIDKLLLIIIYDLCFFEYKLYKNLA